MNKMVNLENLLRISRFNILDMNDMLKHRIPFLNDTSKCACSYR